MPPSQPFQFPATKLEAFAVQADSEAPRSLGRFFVDPQNHTVEYSISPEMESYGLAIHGFAPRGWATGPLLQLPAGQLNGVWDYPSHETRNVLAGLAYLKAVPLQEGATTVRAQIEPTSRETPQFEDFVSTTFIAGECQGAMSVFGKFENVMMDMEPAQVIIARTPARELPDGRREQELGCALRVGGSDIPGLGRVEIGMYGDRNPGYIISMHPGSDFPARMTLDVRKSYITTAGTFYRDNEEFVAENIPRFPPFGVRFTPVEPIAPLREAATGEIVGQIHLHWLVPLCYVDPSVFPSPAVTRAQFWEDPSGLG
jgi:hypothetical protein